MALNKAIFRTRAISAIIFALVMVAGLLWNQWSFLLLFSSIHFGCWREYLILIEKIYNIKFNTYVRAGFLLTGYSWMLAFCSKTIEIAGYGLKENICFPLAIAGFCLLIGGIFFKRNALHLKGFMVAMLGWVYISMAWGMMLGLRQGELLWKGEIFYYIDGRMLPVILIMSIWINDTMAYIVGSFIGKTPFSAISPKKTWEGTIGGIVLCIVTMMLTGYWIFRLPFTLVIIVAALASIVGTAGDLLESKLKRMAGVKDSGNMMPGHGGFLDRFDSLLLATPFVWLYIKSVF